MKKFVMNRAKGLICAIKGGITLVSTEHSVMVQCSLFVIITILGFYFDISKQDWINQILAIALVLGLEGLNTALEKMADYIQPDFDKRIGFIKDISAGAVSFGAIAALLIFLIIYIPYFV